MHRWLIAAALLGAPAAVSADEETDWNRDFGFLTVGVSGGFQQWSLSDLETADEARVAAFAEDGYMLESGSYPASLAYGLDLQFRFSRAWFARAQFDWTRLSVDDRDRQSLWFLGGRERTAVSLTSVTRVQTRPLLASFGLGRAWRSPSLRWGLSTGFVVAPLKVVDEIGVFMESDTVSEVEARGTGFGADLALSCDYFTDSNMNIFAEVFGRTGAATVELVDDVWESSILPGSRRVNLDGFGLRVGFRWI